MARGKYSPKCPHANTDYDFCYNSQGQLPASYRPGTDVFNPRIHMNGYDSEGYDRYGYSDFLEDGTYVGLGQGIDRNGKTEDEYFNMNDDEFDWGPWRD